jgi:hypothetical protein
VTCVPIVQRVERVFAVRIAIRVCIRGGKLFDHEPLSLTDDITHPRGRLFEEAWFSSSFIVQTARESPPLHCADLCMCMLCVWCCLSVQGGGLAHPHCPLLMHVTCAADVGWHREMDPYTGLPIVCCGDHSTKRAVFRLKGERARHAKRVSVNLTHPVPLPLTTGPLPLTTGPLPLTTGRVNGHTVRTDQVEYDQIEHYAMLHQKTVVCLCVGGSMKKSLRTREGCAWCNLFDLIRLDPPFPFLYLFILIVFMCCSFPLLLFLVLLNPDYTYNIQAR